MNRPKRHGPNRLGNYLGIHETVLGQLTYQGLVSEDRLKLDPGADGQLTLEGELLLRDGCLRLEVTKVLEIVEQTEDAGDTVVQTAKYSYNLSVPGLGNVFRYDSPHDDGADIHHHQYHHRHEYFPFSGDTDHNVVKCDYEGDWPLLGEVIQEADDWYWLHSEELAKHRK